MACAEKSIEFESHVIRFDKAENNCPWFLREVNPKGTVPAMKHGDRSFTDSWDIVVYVDSLPSPSKINTVKQCYS